MRPQFFIALGVIFIIVAALTLVAFLFVDEDRFGDVVTATAMAVDTNAPIDETSEFDPGTTAVFAMLEVRDLDAGDTFEFRWQGEADDEPLVTEFELPEDVGDDTIWVYGVLENEEGLPSGNYTVEVYHDGDLVGDTDFTVADE